MTVQAAAAERFHKRDEASPRTELQTGVREATSLIELRNFVDRTSIERLLPTAEKVIGKLATVDTVMRVARHNGDSVWLFTRAGRSQPEGFQAYLLLNEAGRDQLFSQGIDLRDPPTECLVRQGETPALIYVWATYTPGILAAGIPLVVDHFSSPRYGDKDMVSWSATERGHRAMVRIGFTKGITWRGQELPHLYRWARSPETLASLRPRYDSYVQGRSGITVCHELGDLLKVAAVRAAVYIGEQHCPYAEEFDGNDFAATHLLAFADDEPAGCMRVRFFGDFAKMERLAVRSEYRKSPLAFDLVRAAVDLCRAKGFRKLYGHARKDLLPFWLRFGFKVKPGEPFGFSDQVFVEMVVEIAPTNDAIRLDDDPYRIIRPEGQWHRPGVLEQSAARQA